ncbi:MAG TPA: flagellar assembly protein FliW [Bacillales bacterium]
MKMNTKYQGIVEVEDRQVIHFENGLPGFSHERRFIVSPFANDTPFFILQSVDSPSLAFVAADPFLFYKDYDFVLPDWAAEQLEIESEEEAAVYAVLTLQDPFEKTTANLQAPILINHRKHKGKQLVLDDSQYGTRHLLMSRPSPARQEGKGC